jgi:hypothetical protein
MWARNLLLLSLVGGGAVVLAGALVPPSVTRSRPLDLPPPDESFQATLQRLQAAFRQQWRAHHLQPAPPAPELAVTRRLALGLMGTVPSVEEIRQFEARPEAERIDWYLSTILQDRRFADYLAERLARAYVGTEDGPFLVFRRRRFVNWLSDEILDNRPYDQIVRRLIAGEGLWTNQPETNFVTVTIDDGKVDPERLAGRVARAFLGIRLDCAQCHNHPFAPWTQEDFQGLAAFFGQVEPGLTGIHEGRRDYMYENKKRGEKVRIDPRVPFAPDLLPARGTRRQRLAEWVAHPDNPHLARATVNRLWALMLGRPLVPPVDDIPTDEPRERLEGDNPLDEVPRALEILAQDFRRHGYDLKRLIRLIAHCQVFRQDSAADDEISTADEQAWPRFLGLRAGVGAAAEARLQARDRTWAVFPLSPLRPEQVAGAILQAGSLATINSEAHILFRLARDSQVREFVQRYGDVGEDEFDLRTSTVPQRLLLMNSDWVKEHTKEGPFSASSRIALLAPDAATAVELAYLAVLSRRPTAPELDHFVPRLQAAGNPTARNRILEDLYWTLINSTEFAFSH